MRSRRRRWLFRLAGVALIPLLLLCALEAGLRVAGFGFPATFFLASERDGQPVLIENGKLGWLFFPRPLSRAPLPAVVPVPKRENTWRIFVFGESAAKGEPEPAFGFPRVLQALLEARFPEHRIEVINVAVTAFNSHTILPIAGDCARRDGDAWVVYLGNNEVLGPYGAGSVFGARSPNRALLRISLALKSTRTGQLMDSLLGSLASGDSVPESWGGMEMFLKQQFRRDDPRMETVYRHFAANLGDILDAGTKSGARIVLCTLVSNLKDCAPFASLHASGLDESRLAEWEKRYGAGKEREGAGDLAAAIEAYQKAAEIDGSHAELQFRMARSYFAAGSFKEALEHYTQARDLDTIRFRADTRTNEVIRAAAAKSSQEGVTLLDLERIFAAASPRGIPGEEAFYEHVHFNYQGNYLLARPLAEKIVETLKPRPGSKVSGEWLDSEQCARRLAYTPFEEARVTEAVIARLSRPPYNTQLNHPERHQRFQQMLDAQRRAESTIGFAPQAAVYQAALSRAPEDWVLHDLFGVFLAEWRKDSEAEAEFHQVIRLVPHHYVARHRLGVLLSDGSNFPASERYFREALALRPDFAEARQGLGTVLAKQGRHEAACAEFAAALKLKPELLDAHLRWADSLLALGRKEDAEPHYRKVLERRPGDARALLGLEEAAGRGAGPKR